MSLKKQTAPNLKSYQFRPKKYAGQHFLISSSVVKKIIAAANVKPGETVLEIGPGTGVLTQSLLETGVRVIAVEKDQDLAALLKSQCPNPKFKINPKPQVQIINQDILAFDESGIKEDYKIVANIPYYITGPIIQKFLFSKNPPSEMVLMVQKEVGERITARPPRANYLSSLVQSFAEVKILFKVKKENFWPKPKVDSAVIRIATSGKRQATGHKKQKLEHYVRFLRIVFRQPRQTLWNNLRRAKIKESPRLNLGEAAIIITADKLERVFERMGLDKNIRGQNLNQQQLSKLFSHLYNS